MLNHASMLQHFLTPTASNGSPLKVLLRRDFARGCLLEQALFSASSDYLLGTFPLWLKRVPLSGAECEARKKRI